MKHVAASMVFSVILWAILTCLQAHLSPLIYVFIQGIMNGLLAAYLYSTIIETMTGRKPK